MNKMMKYFLYLMFITVLTLSLQAKHEIHKKVYIDKKENKLSSLLKKFETELNITFAYSASQIDSDLIIKTKIKRVNIYEFLKILKRNGIKSKIKSDIIVLFREREKKKFTISGYIEDKTSGERLIGANVYNPKTYKGSVSNGYGFFSFPTDEDTKELNFSYVGYRNVKVKIENPSDTLIIIEMNPSIEIEEVVVNAKSSEVIDRNLQIGLINLPLEKLKSAPVALGEVDVMKVAQLLPGVSEGSEGNSGMYIRGGSQDQNLIILDGVNVYNPNHLFGFFSVFNADAIKDFKLIKGAFPARYGGKLSSVIDLSMREGNMKKFSGGISVGLISSKAYVEGPLIKDKTSFFLSARRTYIDLLASNLMKNVTDYDQSDYYFYDINAKLNHKFSNNHRLYLSYYKGRDEGGSHDKNDGEKDRIQIEEKSDVSWGNSIYGLRWNWLMGSQLFLNTTFSYSSYDYFNDQAVKNQFKVDDILEVKEYSNNVQTGIDIFSGGMDFNWYLSDIQNIRFGGKFYQHRFNTGMKSRKFIKGENVDSKVSEDEIIKAKELNFYLEDNIDLFSNFSTNLGVHYSMFNVNGKTYKSIEPRLSFKYDISDAIQLNAGGAMMQQYTQQLSFSRISLSSDIWVPATENIAPAKSKQASMGVNWKLNDTWSFSTESYFKYFDNVLEYSESASFFENDSWQKRVEQGEGKSYGVEFLLEKSQGDLTGWVAYTLAESTRKFEKINNGQEFPYKYDRRHDLSIVLNYKLSKNWSINSVWKYRSGNAETFGVIKYQNNLGFNSNVSSFNDVVSQKRNNYRMPAYHRLDLSINWTKKLNTTSHIVSFGVYNLYNKKNPYKISIKNISVPTPQGYYIDTKKMEEKSLFGILPSISYTFKF